MLILIHLSADLYFELEITSIQLMFDGAVRSVLGVAFAVVWSRTLSSGRDVIQR